ncbi:hypothetical protein BD410DRAFT_804251 [Rickenella mellea]|uniref:Uncharacterized protein n=1 Tax=Rickenella mellea TaxID=50990 RepID=A0A4Y7Q0Y4_9AGAM|nr:hypothetical protein BD410DRAFT_804251 [Rickenella mellea]
MSHARRQTNAQREELICTQTEAFKASSSSTTSAAAPVPPLVYSLVYSSSTLCEEYVDRVLAMLSMILPSPKCWCHTTRCSRVSTNQLMDPWRAVTSNVFDIETLYDITVRTLKIEDSVFEDSERPRSTDDARCETSLRFPEKHTGHLRKLSLNLIPYLVYLHFLMPSFALFFDPEGKATTVTNTITVGVTFVTLVKNAQVDACLWCTKRYDCEMKQYQYP